MVFDAGLVTLTTKMKYRLGKLGQPIIVWRKYHKHQQKVRGLSIKKELIQCEFFRF